MKMKNKILAALFIACASLPAAAADKNLFSGADSKQPIEINADSLEVFQADKKAIFAGNVEAKQGSMTVQSNKMTVYYSGGDGEKSKDGGGNAISKIDLDGNVFLKTPTESARAQKGYYDTKRNFVSLIGDVVLTRDKNILKGSRLDFDINTGHSKLVSAGATQSTEGASGAATGGGRVRGLFVPEQ